MSNFTPLVDFETEFEGDTIKAKLARLKRKDFIKLRPVLAEMGALDEDTNEFKVTDQGKALELMDLTADMLPEYVKEFTGLKDGDGNALTINDVTEEAYFMMLAQEIIQKLFNISGLGGEEDVKN